MNRETQVARLSWGPVALIAGFAFFAFSMCSFDWSAARAQEKAAEPKAKAKNGFRKGGEGFAGKKSAPSAVRPIPGTGKKLDQTALTKIIDEEINARLQSEGVKSSAQADDAEFLRRLSLDLISVIPTSQEVVEFLDSKDPAKRAKIIDKMLNDPRFGKFQAEIWAGNLLPRESNNRALNRDPLLDWLSAHFNKNTPLNEIVFELLTAKGTQEENGAVTYYIANPTVDKMTDTATRHFLGVQLQCAQCHNHPFTDWKQAEYWGMAQFFMKVRLSANPQQAAKKGISPGVMETAQPFAKKNGLPESAMKVKAKFLGAEEPGLAATEPYRPVLAQWMCSPQNPYFAKAMVNRYWGHLFGRGLVNPIDDMHENNLPTHPELLSALTEQFKSNNFDLKFLIRAMCNSDAYQRSSRPANGNGEDRELYSHRLVRAMLPEQLFESVVAVTGRDQLTRKGNIAPQMQKKGGGNSPRDQFVNFFRVSDEPDLLEYQAGIPQVLRLMNSNVTNSLGSAVAQSIKTAGANEPEKMIEQLYLTGLSRRPTPEETRRLVSFVREHPANPVAAYTDILWSMLNSSEFVLNH